jgi:hypothetical protein
MFNATVSIVVQDILAIFKLAMSQHSSWWKSEAMP